MGIREENKRRTRETIIKETKNVLLQKGYIGLSTKDISNRSEVSQGTIFLHFQSKENLLNYILVQLISDLIDEMKSTCNVKEKREVFLHKILSVLSVHENVLSLVYRDYPHVSDEIKKSIDLSESTMKSLFFDNIRNSKGKEISIVDSFVLIDAFISQIKNHLLSKELNSSSNIIRQSTGKLNKLYRYLFQ